MSESWSPLLDPNFYCTSYISLPFLCVMLDAYMCFGGSVYACRVVRLAWGISHIPGIPGLHGGVSLLSPFIYTAYPSSEQQVKINPHLYIMSHNLICKDDGVWLENHQDLQLVHHSTVSKSGFQFKKCSFETLFVLLTYSLLRYW